MFRGDGVSTVSQSDSYHSKDCIKLTASLVNLPIGAIAIPCIIFFLSSSRQQQTLKRDSWSSVIKQFDPIGTVFFIVSIMCLLIALQWGGSKYAWSDSRVIALITVFGILILAWGSTQWKMGENATVPLRIARQRTVAFATFYILLGSAAFVIPIYYLPIWYVVILAFYQNAGHTDKTKYRFQGIKGDTASESGIHNLPLVLSVGTSLNTRVTGFQQLDKANSHGSCIRNQRRSRCNNSRVLHSIYDCRSRCHVCWRRSSTIVPSGYSHFHVV